jgi:hypothetical protein
MSIHVINKDGKNCPFVVCDHCKLEIFKADEANAIWLGRVFKLEKNEARKGKERLKQQPRCSQNIVGIIYRTCSGGG